MGILGDGLEQCMNDPVKDWKRNMRKPPLYSNSCIYGVIIALSRKLRCRARHSYARVPNKSAPLGRGYVKNRSAPRSRADRYSRQASWTSTAIRYINSLRRIVAYARAWQYVCIASAKHAIRFSLSTVLLNAQLVAVYIETWLKLKRLVLMKHESV